MVPLYDGQMTSFHFSHKVPVSMLATLDAVIGILLYHSALAIHPTVSVIFSVGFFETAVATLKTYVMEQASIFMCMTSY